MAQLKAELAWIEASKRLNETKKKAAQKALRKKVLRAIEDAALKADLPLLAPQPVSQHANAAQIDRTHITRDDERCKFEMLFLPRA